MVARGIVDWEASTRSAVSLDAKGAITTEFQALAKRGVRTKSMPSLTRAYLYKLEERKKVTPGTPVTLSVTDVKGFSPGMFLQDILDKDTGFLRCLSEPVGGAIEIDGEAKGYTVKEFVLTPGKHTIVTRLTNKPDCKETVEIAADETKETHCPKQ